MSEPQPSAAVLPITSCREALVSALRKNRVLVVLGETGSGKTTQLPQFLLEEGLHRRLKSEDDDGPTGERDHGAPRQNWSACCGCAASCCFAAASLLPAALVALDWTALLSPAVRDG